jgi:hypothetical protein
MLGIGVVSARVLQHSVGLSRPDGPRPTHLDAMVKKGNRPASGYFGSQRCLRRENRNRTHSTPIPRRSYFQSSPTEHMTPIAAALLYPHRSHFNHADSSPFHHRSPNHSRHLNGSTCQIGSSATVCGTLDWIPALMRSVWTPVGFHRSVTTSTPTPKVIFTYQHHLPMRSP